MSIQDLNLTDDQEAKIADIMKDCRTKNAEARKELASVVKDETEKVRAVLTAEQKATLEKLKEERKDSRDECLAHRIAHLKELDLTDDELTKIGEIRTEYRPKIAKARKQLEGLLTAEQKEAREEGLKAGKNRREILASLNFTDDQKEKVAAVAKEVGALVGRRPKRSETVLTAAQKEQLQDLQDERRSGARPDGPSGRESQGPEPDRRAEDQDRGDPQGVSAQGSGGGQQAPRLGQGRGWNDHGCHQGMKRQQLLRH